MSPSFPSFESHLRGLYAEGKLREIIAHIDDRRGEGFTVDGKNALEPNVAHRSGDDAGTQLSRMRAFSPRGSTSPMTAATRVPRSCNFATNASQRLAGRTC